MATLPDRELQDFLRLLGTRIRTARKLCGLTQEGMSEFGFNLRHFQKVEAGKANLTLGMLCRLARAFELQPYELLDPTLCIGSRLVVRPQDGTTEVPRYPVATPTEAVFRFVNPAEADKYRTCVPLIGLVAAAGGFSSPEEIEYQGWVLPATAQPLVPGMFVARVEGHSMEPKIPAGSYCLFRRPPAGSRQNRLLLVQHRDLCDPEHGGSYTLKRWYSEKRPAAADEGGWRHREIQLRSLNPAFPPMVIPEDRAEELRVVAEFVAVLGPRR